MKSQPLLVLGTANRKKGRELAQLLAPARLELRTLADFAEAIEVVEDGATFAENAAQKATQQARHLGRWVLADDSGLAVDALGGAPGVYLGPLRRSGCDDAENNRRLLDELGNVPLEGRTARFVCHVTLADPHGAIRRRKRRPPAAADLCAAAATTVSATIRCSRSSSTTIRSANSAHW